MIIKFLIITERKCKIFTILDMQEERKEQMSGINYSINAHRKPAVLSNSSSPSTENSPNTNTFSGTK